MTLAALHKKRAESLEKVAFSMLSERVRVLQSPDEKDGESAALREQYATLTTARVLARMCQIEAIDRERAHAAFCRVREYSTTRKTSPEILNAPRTDSHDIIETSLEVRTTSLHAHAPPRFLTTHRGAAQVIT
jgi:hypothetical protein